MDNNIEVAFFSGIRTGIDSFVNGLKVIADSNNGNIPYTYIKLVAQNTINTIDFELKNSENGQKIINILEEREDIDV